MRAHKMFHSFGQTQRRIVRFYLYFNYEYNVENSIVNNGYLAIEAYRCSSIFNYSYNIHVLPHWVGECSFHLICNVRICLIPSHNHKANGTYATSDIEIT